jgi:glycosyltransferase involved in cell wall biosynthesis
MKIVNISTSDKRGGAAIAAYRIHKVLLQLGHDSKMLVLNKVTDDERVVAVNKGSLKDMFFTNLRKLVEKIFFYSASKLNRMPFYGGLFGHNLSKRSIIQEADVLNIHWINGGFLSIRGLHKLCKLSKKVVFTLHDSWLFTGGCHVRYGCMEYEDSCACCKILTGERKRSWRTKFILRYKIRLLKQLDFEVVTPSAWLGECAKSSTLLNNHKIDVIPNPVSSFFLKSVDKSEARESLGLDVNKKYILFGAVNAIKTPYKGWSYLRKALMSLSETIYEDLDRTELLIFGASGADDLDQIPFKVNFLGNINSEEKLSLVYHAADVFVSSSLDDNYPNTINESLHCGTPVAAFSVGGIPEMISHTKNGYLAVTKDYESLRDGIVYCLSKLNRVEPKVSMDETKYRLKTYFDQISN